MTIERTKNDHNTPESVLEIIRAYAPIGLDPCSNMWSTVGARVELCKQRGEDGLELLWSEVLRDGEIVYVNPPYAAGQIMPWVDAAWGHVEFADVETLMLVPCSPETRWAKAARDACSAWGVWKKRIPFVGAGGQGMKGPSALYHFGPHRYRFAHHFEPHLAFLEVR